VENIVIRVGSATESVTPRRRAEVGELAALLRDDDRSVAIEERERIPERYGVVWAETVAIFIGTAAGSGLIGAIVSDVYNTAKRWARDQWKKKTTEASPGGRVRSQSFTLYGPDEKPVLFWKISYEGEKEQLYQQIEPKPDDSSGNG
jgi:hypothetical protein